MAHKGTRFNPKASRKVRILLESSITEEISLNYRGLMKVRRIKVIFLGLVFFALHHPVPLWSKSDPVRAKSYIVSSQHPLATQAGIEILKNGGNAMDAAVSVSLTLSVVEPYGSGIGGGAFLLYYDAKAKNFMFGDFRERAPAKASRDMYLQGGKVIPHLSQKGWLAPGVPGLVAGLESAHQRWGNLSFSSLVKPAIQLASKGFLVDWELHQRLEEKRDQFLKDPEAVKIFYPSGQSLPFQSLLIQKDLAKTLKRLANKGAKDFYFGKTSQLIAQAFQNQHGLITKMDLSHYQPFYIEPIRGDYRGFEIISAPPPSSGGGVLIQILNLLSSFDFKKLGFGSADAIHYLAESMRLSYADRSKYYGDSRFVRVPMSVLLSKEYALKRRNLIRSNKVRPSDQIPFSINEGQNTSHFVIVDRKGNAVSMTQTINTSFGAGVIVPGTGIILNNEMDDFSAAPLVPNAYGLVGGEANSIAPGKTPLSSMSPTIVSKNGRPFLVVGSPGGPRIISSVLQTIINLIDYEMNVRDAVQSPRIHHQYLPDILYLENPGFSSDTIRILKARGHNIEFEKSWSNVQAIQIENQGVLGSEILMGASDDRGQGRVMGF